MAEKILGEFIKTDSKLWNKKFRDDLKKLGHSNILSYNSKENIKIKPFYTSEDLNNLKNTDSTYPNNWRICQNITADNSTDANIKALEFIKKGADSINFVIQNDSISCKELLKNIDIEKTELFFEIKFHSNSFLKSLNNIIKSSSTSFNISYDPIGSFAKSGINPTSRSTCSRSAHIIGTAFEAVLPLTVNSRSMAFQFRGSTAKP